MIPSLRYTFFLSNKISSNIFSKPIRSSKLNTKVSTFAMSLRSRERDKDIILIDADEFSKKDTNSRKNFSSINILKDKVSIGSITDLNGSLTPRSLRSSSPIKITRSSLNKELSKNRSKKHKSEIVNSVEVLDSSSGQNGQSLHLEEEKEFLSSEDKTTELIEKNYSPLTIKITNGCNDHQINTNNQFEKSQEFNSANSNKNQSTLNKNEANESLLVASSTILNDGFKLIANDKFLNGQQKQPIASTTKPYLSDLRRDSSPSSAVDSLDFASAYDTASCASMALASLRFDSPRSVKRKKKLMQKHNKASDQLNRTFSLLSKKHSTNLERILTDDENEEDDVMAKSKIEADFDCASPCKSDFISNKKHTESMYSPISNRSSSSLSSLSPCTSYTSLMDQCSKSLIFAPKRYHTVKELLKEKSFSERRQSSKGTYFRKAHEIFGRKKPPHIRSLFSEINETMKSCSSRTESCNQKPLASAIQSNSSSPDENKPSLQLTTNIMDQIMEGDNDNSAKSPWRFNCANRININKKRSCKRLFDPNSYNIESRFEDDIEDDDQFSFDRIASNQINKFANSKFCAASDEAFDHEASTNLILSPSLSKNIDEQDNNRNENVQKVVTIFYFLK
jgi:hypothetical protein